MFGLINLSSMRNQIAHKEKLATKLSKLIILKPTFISLIISGVLSLIFVIFGTRIPTFTKFDYYTGYAFLVVISVLLLLAVIIAIFEVGDWPVIIFLSAVAASFIWFNKRVQLANSNYQIWLSSLIGTTIILVAYYKRSSIVD